MSNTNAEDYSMNYSDSRQTVTKYIERIYGKDKTAKTKMNNPNYVTRETETTPIDTSHLLSHKSSSQPRIELNYIEKYKVIPRWHSKIMKSFSKIQQKNKILNCYKNNQIPHLQPTKENMSSFASHNASTSFRHKRQSVHESSSMLLQREAPLLNQLNQTKASLLTENKAMLNLKTYIFKIKDQITKLKLSTKPSSCNLTPKNETVTPKKLPHFKNKSAAHLMFYDEHKLPSVKGSDCNLENSLSLNYFINCNSSPTRKDIEEMRSERSKEVMRSIKHVKKSYITNHLFYDNLGKISHKLGDTRLNLKDLLNYQLEDTPPKTDKSILGKKVSIVSGAGFYSPRKKETLKEYSAANDALELNF